MTECSDTESCELVERPIWEAQVVVDPNWEAQVVEPGRIHFHPKPFHPNDTFIQFFDRFHPMTETSTNNFTNDTFIHSCRNQTLCRFWGCPRCCVQYRRAGDIEQNNVVQPQSLGLGFQVFGFLGFLVFWFFSFFFWEGEEEGGLGYYFFKRFFNMCFKVFPKFSKLFKSVFSFFVFESFFFAFFFVF